MKKKVTRSSRTHKMSAKKTTHKRTTRRVSAEPSFISFRRIVIFSTCLLLFVTLVSFVNSGNVSGSVAGISIARGMYAQTTVSLPVVPSAVAYNIYYKQANEGTYTHAVRNIPPTVTQYTISYLKRSTAYQYKISALDSSGKEFWWSATKYLTNITSM